MKRKPLHLIGSICIEADKYQFSLVKKSVAKSGKEEGKTTYRDISHHATPEQVHSKLESMCATELINGDWNRMIAMFRESRANFIKALPKLIERREGTL